MISAPKQQWIGAGGGVSAPLFRREFGCSAPPTRAILLVSGLGYHEAWLNGEKVGNHVLDPAQTDYEQRVFYVRHEVTKHLLRGGNALGIILGNGWYNQDRVWGKNGLSYGPPRLMAELHLCYADSTTEVIRADACWRWAPGPITENNVYAGECYDARLEIDGWTLPGFDDSSWQVPFSADVPGGVLQEQVMPPVRCIEELPPVAVRALDSGVQVVDFGQNFAGWARIRVDAPPGTEISLRYAEEVQPDGNVDTSTTGVFATKVEPIDRYTCKGGATETWAPRFTYHGFRYVEVSGWPGPLGPGDIRGTVVHNDLPTAGAFESSDKRLNQLHRMALWTHRSNLHGLPEDCPAREKCGWLGDANLVAEYSLWNYDGAAFWQKYLDDIETNRTLNGGIPGHVAPGKRCNTYGQPDWAAAYIMLTWYLYLFSGDKGIVERHWDGLVQLIEHFRANAENWILHGGFGDFFDPGTDAIVQHTANTLTTTLWLHRCADVMAIMGDALNIAKSAAPYRNWRGDIAAALVDRFFDERRGTFGSQTADAMALAFGVLPGDESRILDALVRDVRERDTHLNVGVMGLRFILEVLTRHGHGELALALMHRNSYPSFGHLIGRGATTLWESWGEDGHDGTHGPRSRNHPFMGGYDNGFFNTLAGIRPDPARPGFTHFFLVPHPIRGVDWVRCHHDCPYGRIESNWRSENGTVHWNATIPPGTTASATLPGTTETVELSTGTHHFSR